MEKAIKFRRLGTMIDCSRNAVMNLPALKKLMDILADLGYTTLLLYTEDTYEVGNQPYFGYLRGRYSQEELREIDDYAAQKGLDVIPCIQTLAHLNAIFRWGKYKEINDCNDILLAGDDQTYQLIDDMFAALSETFRTKTVNIGMDEAHMLGRGKYFDRHGVQDRSQILVEHLKRVAEIAAKYGLHLIMWGDMFFRLISGGAYYDVDNLLVSDEVRAKIPENVDLIYWDYYSTDQTHYDRQIKTHNAIKQNSWFAGGLWTWAGFAPHNSHSMQATSAAFAACLENGVQDVFLTMWGDNGGECTPFALLPSLYYAAELAKGETDTGAIKKGFEKKFHIPFDAFMLLDLPGTPNEGGRTNAEKYLLYNDCFMGIFDCCISGSEGDAFAKCAGLLKQYENEEAFGYLFRAMRALCEVLSQKADIGVKTRQAYQSSDRAAMAELLPLYDSLLAKTEAFYRVYREQWMKVNKPHGFDVQDIRLGGLMCRIRHCRERIEAYANGETARIEELEEQLLDSDGISGAEHRKEHGNYNNWGGTVTANVL